MQREEIIIGSRSSPLALAMAHEVKACLARVTERPLTIKPIITSGDRIRNRPLSEVGGKGLFTKEIEQALVNGEVDVAVHSMKDMPTLLAPELIISGYLKREDARDCFISACGRRFTELPWGATIGTAALRRQALAKKMRPDLNIILLRGNVESRLKKTQNGRVDGTFLALAGVKRLGLEHQVTEIMSIEKFPPAPGQGVICLETCAHNEEIYNLVRTINDTETELALACERSFLARLDGSCRTPLAGYATIDKELLSFYGIILTPDGKSWFETRQQGLISEGCAIGSAAADALKRQAGAQFFDDWHG